MFKNWYYKANNTYILDIFKDRDEALVVLLLGHNIDDFKKNIKYTKIQCDIDKIRGCNIMGLKSCYYVVTVVKKKEQITIVRNQSLIMQDYLKSKVVEIIAAMET